MNAQDLPFTQLLDGAKQFIVPIFQRDYSWGTKHCLQLWDDVIRVGKDANAQQHFIGSVGEDRSACPACLSSGFLKGTLWSEEVVDSDPGWSQYTEEGEEIGEPPSETVEKTFTVEAFFCPTCKLRLFGTKEITAAELPEGFSLEEEREREFEEEYGND